MMKKVAKFGNQPDVKKLAAQCAIQNVVQRTFRAYNKEGIVKIQSTARTMEEAIQKTYDVLGDYATLYNYRWVD